MCCNVLSIYYLWYVTAIRHNVILFIHMLPETNEIEKMFAYVKVCPQLFEKCR